MSREREIDATHYVNLWLANDPGLYGEAYEYTLMAMQLDASEFQQETQLAIWLEDLVRTTAERDQPELFESGNFIADIFTNALGSVSWGSIAGDWLDETRLQAANA